MTPVGPVTNERVELARSRRRYIREHHPDRGGDARAFAAGIDALDAARRAAERPVRVTVVHRPRGVRRLTVPLLARLRPRPPRVR